MTIERACRILQNPKSYWSHEVEEAKQIAIKVFQMIVTLPDFNDTLDKLRTMWGEGDEG